MQVEVGVPSADNRLSILALLLRDVPHNLHEQEVAKIAAGLHGFVGADISLLVSTAVAGALRRAEALRSSVQVELEDLRGARSAVGPSALRETVVEVPKVYLCPSSSSLLLSSLELSDSLLALDTSPPRNRCTFM